jgi:O-antigen ligase
MERRGSLFQYLGWLCLVAPTIVAAWRFGGVKAFDQSWILACLTAGALFLLAASWQVKQHLPQVPRVIWPLLAALLFGAIQLIPLPSAVHRMLSPQSLEWWSTLSADEMTEPAEAFPLSLYPGSTKLNFAALALGTGAFLLAAAFRNNRQLALWLLLAGAVNGAATALFGIVQMLSFNGKLYWTIPLAQGGTPFAAFVNQNHAAGYLNLCLATAIGLYVYLAARDSEERSSEHDLGWNDEPQGEWQFLAVGAICVLIATAVVCTTSRGGVVAVVVAFGAAVFFDPRLRSKRSFYVMISVALFAAIGLAVWLGRGVSLHARFQRIWSANGLPTNSRLDHWSDSLRAAADFWQTGSGFGTYRFAYRPFESSFVDGWYVHAENHYVEALLEGGLPGLLMMLAAIFFAFRAILRRRQEQDAVSLALATAGFFGLTAQAVHALFDFGLYMPSNALLFGALLGAAGAPGVQSTEPTGTPLRRTAWSAVLFGLLVWCAWSVTEMRQQADFEARLRHYANATKSFREDATSSEPLPLLNRDRDYAEEQLLNANIGLTNYQIATFHQLRAEIPTADASMLWRLSDPRVLHLRAHQIATEDEASLRMLRDSLQVRNHLAPAYDALLLAREQCPLLPRVHMGLAQVGILFDDGEHEELRIHNAQVLAPFLPDVLFQNGLMDLEAGRAEAGFARWKRCLLLSPRYIDQVMKIAASVISTTELFERVLPRSAERLVQIADSYYSNPEAESNRVRLAAMAFDALATEITFSPAERTALEGHIYRLQGKDELAIERLTVAVGLLPQDIQSRFELAKLLLADTRLSEAQHHATILLKLAPGPSKHRALLKEVQDQLLNQFEN